MGTRLEVKNSGAADDVRPFAENKGKAEILNLGDETVMRGTFEPGWQWSKHVKPLAGTPSCQVSHVGYCIAGRMKIMMDDGETHDIGPGDFFTIEPGHDARVLGNEACVMLDFGGVRDYAKKMVQGRKAA